MLPGFGLSSLQFPLPPPSLPLSGKKINTTSSAVGARPPDRVVDGAIALADATGRKEGQKPDFPIE
jgi:hypothetical protein